MSNNHTANHNTQHKNNNVITLDYTFLDQLYTTSNNNNTILQQVKQNTNNNNNIILIVLNNTIDSIFESLYELASYTIYCDGACNRVYNYCNISHNDIQQQQPQYIPDLIIGDFDSIDTNVYNYYKQHVNQQCIIKDNDEYSTDLHKALNYIINNNNNTANNNNKHITTQDTIIIYNGYGGRLDQHIGCLHTLYKYNSVFDRMVMINEQNICELLRQGTYNIVCSNKYHPTSTTHCGYWSLHGIVNSVTTKGLKYDVNSQIIDFNGLISYCNIIDNNNVTIETTDQLMWNIELCIA